MMIEGPGQPPASPSMVTHPWLCALLNPLELPVTWNSSDPQREEILPLLTCAFFVLNNIYLLRPSE